MKKLIVVTVSYNTSEDTKAFLKALEKVHTPNFSLETIVVDNGSEKVFALDHTYKNLKIIRLETNTGFTGGYNIGIKKALERGADYLLIVNNDTIMDQDLCKNLIAVLESDMQIGVAAPKIYFAKGNEFHKDRYKTEELGKVFWYAGGSIDWANVQSIHRGVDEVDHGQYDNTEQVDFVTGCCMMIKREVLEKVGFFDERYFLYYEDADLNVRIKRAGYKLSYVPDAKLWHVNAASSGSGSSLHDYFLTRNQMLFGMSYAPLRSKIALLKQSVRFLLNGRPKQKQGIRDFYLGKFGKGTFFEKK